MLQPGPPRPAVVAAAVLCGACVLAVLRLPAAASSVLSDVAQGVAALLAATTTARRARRLGGRSRAACGLLALGCLSWGLGEIYWTCAAANEGAVPFPSAADVGFLGFPLLAGASLVMAPAAGVTGTRWQRLLDGLMSAGAVGLISWMTSLGAAVRATNETQLEQCLLLAYPLGDVLLAVLAVRVLVGTSLRHRPLQLVAMGVLALGVSDSAFTYLQVAGLYGGGLVDLGWICGFALISLAGTCRPGAAQDPTTTHALAGGRASHSPVLPYLPGVLTLVVVGVGALSGRSLRPAEELAACLVVIALIGRQFMTLRDNARLTSELLRREEQLRHQAFHDPLTQLANSALFRDRLDHALARRGRDLTRLTVIFVDLDDFKAVNDTHGHAAGDRLLVESARRLSSGLRPGDTVARLGGDEFAVLVEDGGLSDNRAAGIAAALRGPVWVTPDVSVELAASIGVHGLGPDDPDCNADEILAAADAAMYTVKRTRKRGTPGIRTGAPAIDAHPVGASPAAPSA